MTTKQSEVGEDDFDALVADLWSQIQAVIVGKPRYAAWYALIELAYAGCQDQDDLEELREIIDEVDEELCDETVVLQ